MFCPAKLDLKRQTVANFRKGKDTTTVGLLWDTIYKLYNLKVRHAHGGRSAPEVHTWDHKIFKGICYALGVLQDLRSS
jgi:hypothetical protein